MIRRSEETGFFAQKHRNIQIAFRIRRGDDVHQLYSALVQSGDKHEEQGSTGIEQRDKRRKEGGEAEKMLQSQSCHVAHNICFSPDVSRSWSKSRLKFIF